MDLKEKREFDCCYMKWRLRQLEREERAMSLNVRVFEEFDKVMKLRYRDELVPLLNEDHMKVEMSRMFDDLLSRIVRVEKRRTAFDGAHRTSPNGRFAHRNVLWSLSW